ncbi:MAG TPA: hypothetical protein VF198_01610 [Vicinamibacterales bacterium]
MLSRDLEERLARLARSTERDGVSELTIVKRLHLEPTRYKHLTKVTLNDDGELFVLDAPNSLVAKFAPDGSYEGRIARRGRARGALYLPVDIAVANGKLYVLEFDPRRITILTFSGDLIDTIHYGQLRLSLHALQPEEDGSILVVGQSHTGTDAYIHRLSPEGRVMSSMGSKELIYGAVPSGTSYGHSRFQRHRSGLLMTSVVKYQILRIERDDVHPLRDVTSPEMVLPKSEIPTSPDPAEGYKGFYDWRATWAPIDAFVVVKDTAVIQRQVLSPLRYATDVWDLGTGRRVLTFSTNYLAVAQHHDHVYWMIPPDMPGATGEVIVTLPPGNRL